MTHRMMGVALALLGIAFLVRPGLLAGRFADTYAAASRVALGLGAACVPLALCIGLWPRLRRHHLALQCGTAVLAYLGLTAVFGEWHIDDAAITYAYSENLARGFGLVLHPSHAPQEGYSTTLWMLVLAGCRALGFDVAASAKVLGTAIGATVPVLVLVLLARLRGRPLGGAAFAATLATLLTVPYVIWSVSGLEHGLQALLLLGMIWGALQAPVSLRALALCGSALVLTRPEAPLVVAALCCYLAVEAYAARRRVGDVLHLWPAALVPAAVLLALFAFRVAYFGDPMPNPFYAKAHDATFLRVVNPFGTGWRYVTGWLARGAGFLPVAIVWGAGLRGLPRSMRPALAVLLGQLAFVLYAGGDWMAHWRFLAAPIAVLALLVGHAMQQVSNAAPRLAKSYALYGVSALVLSNVPLLVEFRAKPTSPYLTVAAIGNEFVALARRLGIEHPVLAHHDAGGISYRARLDLLDLGGLGDRYIAKHMRDAALVRRYVLEERKPDFVFGERDVLGAKSRFYETEQFERDYVPIVFEDAPFMKSGLSHVRREHVHDVPGVVLEREGERVLAVHVPKSHSTVGLGTIAAVDAPLMPSAR